MVHNALKDIQEKTSVAQEARDKLEDIYHGNVARNMFIRSELIPSPEDMARYLCISLYHGNYNKAALGGLCDIMHTIRYVSEETDWKLFWETVGQGEIAGPVYFLTKWNKTKNIFKRFFLFQEKDVGDIFDTV